MVTSGTEAAHPSTRGQTVCLCVGLACLLTTAWLMTSTVFPGFGGTFLQARDVATALAGVVALGLAFAAMHSPRVFANRGFFVVAAGGMLGGALAMAMGTQLANPWLMVAGSCVRSVTQIWLTVCYGLALTSVSPKRLPVVLIGAFLLRYGLIAALSMLPEAIRYGAFVAFPLITLALMGGTAQPRLQAVAQTPPAVDLAITNPLSFFPPTSRLFVLIVLFRAAYGFALTYGEADGQLEPLFLAAMGAVVCLVLFAIGRSGATDAVYLLAFALVVGGFLLVQGNAFHDSSLWALSNALLRIGNEAFDFVALLVVVQISGRNLVGAVPVLVAYAGATSLGIEGGAVLGMLGAHVTVTAAPVASSAVLLAFVLYNVVVLRTFSFDGTVQGVQPATVTVEERPAALLTTEEACERLVEANRLTAREADVLALLARGRNVAFIQDALGLKRNTVKTHVANIYAKLGVHTHQEVIDLVEKVTLE